MANPQLVHALEGLVVGAVGLTTYALEQFAPTVDLTLPQWRTLVVVARGDGVRIGEVAARVGMGVPSMSRLIRRLERRGLVSTERDESDRRATLVRATPEGREFWSTLVDHRRQLIAEILDGVRPALPARAVREVEALEAAFSRYA